MEFLRLAGNCSFQECEKRADRVAWAMADHALHHAEGRTVVVVSVALEGGIPAFKAMAIPTGTEGLIVTA